jgi:hypothetical protein
VSAPGAGDEQVIAAITQAAREQHDFAGWLAGILACAATRLGSSAALTAGRPGSWEAGLVDQLVQGAVGYADEHLDDYRRGPS